jgi:uncharacterized protein YndB with AHSA1/START domain
VPERLQQWMGANEVEIDLVAGGRLVTRTTGPQELVDAIIAEAGKAALETHDTVLRVEPPSLLEHTFGGTQDSVVRWELEPSPEGCILRLAHTEPVNFDRKDSPRDMAGWHELLDLLAEHLDSGRDAGRSWSRERWERHRDRYAVGSSDDE